MATIDENIDAQKKARTEDGTQGFSLTNEKKETLQPAKIKTTQQVAQQPQQATVQPSEEGAVSQYISLHSMGVLPQEKQPISSVAIRQQRDDAIVNRLAMRWLQGEKIWQNGENPEYVDRAMERGRNIDKHFSVWITQKARHMTDEQAETNGRVYSEIIRERLFPSYIWNDKMLKEMTGCENSQELGVNIFKALRRITAPQDELIKKFHEAIDYSHVNTSSGKNFGKGFSDKYKLQQECMKEYEEWRVAMGFGDEYKTDSLDEALSNLERCATAEWDARVMDRLVSIAGSEDNLRDAIRLAMITDEASKSGEINALRRKGLSLDEVDRILALQNTMTAVRDGTMLSAFALGIGHGVTGFVERSVEGMDFLSFQSDDEKRGESLAKYVHQNKDDVLKGNAARNAKLDEQIKEIRDEFDKPEDMTWGAQQRIEKLEAQKISDEDAQRLFEIGADVEMRKESRARAEMVLQPRFSNRRQEYAYKAGEIGGTMIPVTAIAAGAGVATKNLGVAGAIIRFGASGLTWYHESRASFMADYPMMGDRTTPIEEIEYGADIYAAANAVMMGGAYHAAMHGVAKGIGKLAMAEGTERAFQIGKFGAAQFLKDSVSLETEEFATKYGGVIAKRASARLGREIVRGSIDLTTTSGLMAAQEIIKHETRDALDIYVKDPEGKKAVEIDDVANAMVSIFTEGGLEFIPTMLAMRGGRALGGRVLMGKSRTIDQVGWQAYPDSVKSRRIYQGALNAWRRAAAERGLGGRSGQIIDAGLEYMKAAPEERAKMRESRDWKKMNGTQRRSMESMAEYYDNLEPREKEIYSDVIAFGRNSRKLIYDAAEKVGLIDKDGNYKSDVAAEYAKIVDDNLAKTFRKTDKGWKELTSAQQEAAEQLRQAENAFSAEIDYTDAKVKMFFARQGMDANELLIEIEKDDGQKNTFRLRFDKYKEVYDAAVKDATDALRRMRGNDPARNAEEVVSRVENADEIRKELDRAAKAGVFASKESYDLLVSLQRIFGKEKVAEDVKKAAKEADEREGVEKQPEARVEAPKEEVSTEEKPEEKASSGGAPEKENDQGVRIKGRPYKSVRYKNPATGKDVEFGYDRDGLKDDINSLIKEKGAENITDDDLWDTFKDSVKRSNVSITDEEIDPTRNTIMRQVLRPIVEEALGEKSDNSEAPHEDVRQGPESTPEQYKASAESETEHEPEDEAEATQGETAKAPNEEVAASAQESEPFEGEERDGKIFTHGEWWDRDQVLTDEDLLKAQDEAREEKKAEQAEAKMPKDEDVPIVEDKFLKPTKDIKKAIGDAIAHRDGLFKKEELFKQVSERMRIPTEGWDSLTWKSKVKFEALRMALPEVDFNAFSKADDGKHGWHGPYSLYNAITEHNAPLILGIFHNAAESPEAYKVLRGLGNAINIFTVNDGIISDAEALASSDIYTQYPLELFSRYKPEGLDWYLGSFYVLDTLSRLGDNPADFFSNGAIPEDLARLSWSELASNDYAPLQNVLNYHSTEIPPHAVGRNLANAIADGRNETIDAWNKFLEENRAAKEEKAEKEHEAAEEKKAEEEQEKAEEEARENPPMAAPTAVAAEAAAGVKDAEDLFASEVARRLLAKESLDLNALKAIAKQYSGLDARFFDEETGGRALQQLAELGIARAARKIAFEEGKTWGEKYAEIVELYNNQPRIGNRTSTTEDLQQYSTPIPIAYLADLFVMGINPKKVLEPTAGNGLLVHGVPEKSIHANEIDPLRRKNLMRQAFANVTGANAMHSFKKNGNTVYDAVVANPPFGSAPRVHVDTFYIGGLENRIALNALASMRNDGRAAIIVGGHTKYSEKGNVGTDSPGQFLNYLYSRYNVLDIININGDLYARQGTNYPIRLILIDGRKENLEKQFAPRRENARAEVVNSFDELRDRVAEHFSDRELTDEAKCETDDIPDDEIPQELPKPIAPEVAPKEETSEDKGEIAPAPINYDTTVEQDTVEPITDSVERREAGEKQTTAAEREAEVVQRETKKQAEETPNEPARPVETATLETANVKYPTVSSITEIGSITPYLHTEKLNIRRIQIERDEAKRKIDDFVMEECGYKTREELEDAMKGEQVDGVAFAISAMKKGDSFIIGDQAGLGKGRQGAALVRWGVKHGKKVIYVTESEKLFTDHYVRDMVDIGSGDLKPYIVNANVSIEREVIDSEGNAVKDKNGNVKKEVVVRSAGGKQRDAIFEEGKKTGKLPEGYDYILTTYSQFTKVDKPTKNGVKRISDKERTKNDWLYSMADNAIVIMDEAHKASGTLSATGKIFRDVVDRADGVTFMSATFAKRPDNLPIYLQKTAFGRLGKAPEEWVQILSNKQNGIILQELVSESLAGGNYIRRERDFTGVTVDYLSVSGGDKKWADLAVASHDECVGLMNAFIVFQKYFLSPIYDALFTQDVGKNKKLKPEATEFANVFQTYVSTMMLSLKAKKIAENAIAHIKAGRAPVIALHNTNEKKINDLVTAGEDVDMPKFSDGLKMSLNELLESYTMSRPDGEKEKLANIFEAGEDWVASFADTDEKKTQLRKMYREAKSMYNDIISRIDSFRGDIVLDPIDLIKREIEEAGYKVNEITGRKTEMIKSPVGGNKWILRGMRIDKVEAAAAFNRGDADAIILNDSGSTGISLHAGENFINRKQRVMLVAQANLDINTETQMRGRIDRTGQVMRGMYEYYVFKEIEADNRAFMIMKKKLKSLDANTVSSQKSKKGDESGIVDFLNIVGDEVVNEWAHNNVDLLRRMSAKINVRQTNEHGERLVDETGKPLYGGNRDINEVDEDTQARGPEDWVIQEDAAAKISRLVSILPVSVQREFYNDIYKAYDDKIKELGDRNPLKMRDLPLNAKTLSSKVFRKGPNKNSGSDILRGDLMLETIEADVIGKPLEAKNIKNLIKTYLGNKSAEEYRAELVRRVEEYNEKNLKEQELRFNKVTGKRLLEAKTDIQRKEIETDRALKWGIRENEQRAALNKILLGLIAGKKYEDGSVRTALDLRVGSILRVPVDLGSESIDKELGSSFGILVGFKVPEGEGAHLTASSIRMVVATLDSRGLIQIPLSRDSDINALLSQTKRDADRLSEVNLDNWDDKAPKDRRETRQVLTGNLILAVTDEDLRRHSQGQIVNYTTNDGRVKRGILMPKKWEEPVQTSTWRESMDMFMKLGAGKAVYDSTGMFVFRRPSYGDYYYLAMRKSAPNQKKIRNSLSDMLEGREWARKDGQGVWRIVVYSDEIAGVVGWLSDNAKLRVAPVEDKPREQRGLDIDCISKSDTKRFAKEAKNWIGNLPIFVVSNDELNKHRTKAKGWVFDMHEKDSHEVFGFYDPVRKRVYVRENSKVDTVIHEVGGHATWHWIKEHNKPLFRKLLNAAKEATDEVRSYVALEYPELLEEGREEEFAEECFATTLGWEFADQLMARLREQESQSWWAKVRGFFVDAWRKMIHSFKSETIDLDELAKLDYAEAVTVLGKAFMEGKRLGIIKEINDAQDKTRNDEWNWTKEYRQAVEADRLRFQRAAEGAQDYVKRTKINDEWHKLTKGDIKKITDLYAERNARFANGILEVKRKSEVAKQIRNEELAKRQFEKTHTGTEVPDGYRDIYEGIPRFGGENGRVQGWAEDVEGVMREKLSVNLDEESQNRILHRRMRTLLTGTYETAGVKHLIEEDLVKLTRLVDAIENAPSFTKMMSLAEQAEKLIAEKAADKYIEDKRDSFSKMLERHKRPFNPRTRTADRKSSGMAEFFMHELAQAASTREIKKSNRQPKTGKELLEKQIEQASNLLEAAKTEEAALEARMSMRARELMLNAPISEMDDAELNELINITEEILTRGTEFRQTVLDEREAAARGFFGGAVAAVRESVKAMEAKKGSGLQIKNKTLRNVFRFGYTLRALLDMTTKYADKDLRKEARKGFAKFSENLAKDWSNERNWIIRADDNIMREMLRAAGKGDMVVEGGQGNRGYSDMVKAWGELLFEMMLEREGSERFSKDNNRLSDGKLIQQYAMIRQDEFRHMFADLEIDELNFPDLYRRKYEAMDEEMRTLYKRFRLRNELGRFIGPRGRAMADALVRCYEYMAPDIDAQSIRDTMMPLTYRGRNYVPVVRDFLRYMTGGTNEQKARLQFLPGSLIQRTHAKRDIDENADFFEVFKRSRSDIAHYVCYGEERAAIDALLRSDEYKDFTQNVPKLLGRAFGNQLEEFLIHVHNGRMQGEELYGAHVVNMGLRSAIAVSRVLSLGGNFYSMLKQTTSTISYPLELGWWQTIKAMSELPNIIENSKAILNSDQYRARYGVPTFDVISHVSSMKARGNTLPAKTLYYSLLAERAVMMPTHIGDKMPIVLMGGLLYGSLKSKHYNSEEIQGRLASLDPKNRITEEQAQEMASERAMTEVWQAIDRTQQARDLQNKDALSRSKNAFAQSLIQFRTSPLQFAMAELSALEDFMARKDSESLQRLVEAIVHNHMVEPLTIMLVNYVHNLVSGNTDDDKTLEWLQITPLVVGNMDSVPIFGWAEEALVAKIVGETYGYRSVMNIPAAEKAGSVVYDIIGAAGAPFSDKEGEVKKRAKKLAEQSVFVRYVEEAVNNVTENK